MNQVNTESTPKYRWLILAIGVLAQMTFSIAFSGIPVSGVLMRDAYQFSTAQLGFVLGCMGLGVAISEIIWGILTDRFGDKIVLIVGLSLMGATFAVTAIGFVPRPDTRVSPVALGLMLVIAGAVGGSINSSSGRAVMSWFQDGERGFAMSIRQTAIPLGGALGSVLIPWIAAVHGFRSAYYTLAAVCALTTLCVWRWIIEVPAPAPAPAAARAATDTSPLRRFDVWKVALAGALLTVPQMAVLTFAAVFLTDHEQMSMVTITIILVLVQVGGAVLRIVTGRLSDRYKNRRGIIRMISVVAGLAGLGLGLGVLADIGTVWLVVLLVVTGLAGHAWHGIAFTEIAVMSGVQNAGRAIGMMGTTVFTMSFLTPYGIPFVLHQGSWVHVWALVGVLSLLALLLIGRPALAPLSLQKPANT